MPFLPLPSFWQKTIFFFSSTECLYYFAKVLPFILFRFYSPPFSCAPAFILLVTHASDYMKMMIAANRWMHNAIRHDRPPTSIVEQRRHRCRLAELPPYRHRHVDRSKTAVWSAFCKSKQEAAVVTHVQWFYEQRGDSPGYR